MRRMLWLVVLAGCSTTSAVSRPAATSATPPRAGEDHRASPPSGARMLAFTEGTVYALRRCDASAPPELVIELQTADRPVLAVALDLFHGPSDRAPHQIAVGGGAQSRCEPGCTGMVWLEAIEPGTQVRGRLDLTWADGRAARQHFEAPWRGGQWDVQPCPESPDPHP
jgi:hypothetical protein